MRKTLALLAAVVAVSLVIGACAPAAPMSNTPVASGGTMTVAGVTTLGTTETTTSATATMTGDEVQAIRQHLIEMGGEMSQMQQQMMQMGMVESQQMSQQMADFMAAIGAFLSQTQRVVDQMTPEERQATGATLQRLQSDLQQMMAAMPLLTPGPVTTTITITAIGDAAQQMSQMEQMMRSQMPQMDAGHVQAMSGAMSSLLSDMSLLIDQMSTALGRMDPSIRQDMLRQVERMHALMKAMMMAQQATPTATP